MTQCKNLKELTDRADVVDEPTVTGLPVLREEPTVITLPAGVLRDGPGLLGDYVSDVSSACNITNFSVLIQISFNASRNSCFQRHKSYILQF